MKNYYLLLFFLLPFMVKAESSIYSDRDFTQLSGLYELIGEEGEKAPEFEYIYFASNYTAFFSNAKVSYVALNSEKGSEVVEGLRLDVVYRNASSESNLIGERVVQQAIIRKSINGRNYRLLKVKSLSMQEIYPNINLEFFVNEEGGLQYLYDLKEGADPSNIQVQYIGNESLNISDNGDLQVLTSIGTMTESSPITLKGSKEKVVNSQYVLKNDNTIGFAINNHKANKEYIIDPYIRWSTFYGGSGGERTSDMVLDDSNYTYVTGYTESTDFPTSPGAFQSSLNNQQDIAILKLDDTGNLVWATYFGGDKRDEGKSISVANDAKVYITGITESSDFPVSDNSIFKGGIDAILIALNPNGSRIRSSFISGSSDDRGESIIVDGNSLYIAGSTSSSDFPSATTGSLAGDLDAFLLKTDLAGNISFGAFFGGTSAEEAFGLGLDSLGNLIIAGRTSSNNIPVSTTAFQTSNNGADDAFIAKYSPSGTLLWSTYYGGSKFDQILDLGIDDLQNIYFSGFTSSNDLSFPSTLLTDTNYNTTYGGGDFDGLTGKVNASGQFMWTSYIGASAHDELQGVGISNYQSIILSGKTNSSDFEVTDNAHQPTLAGGSDAVILQLDSTGHLIYSSFLGGAQDDDAISSAFSKDNRYFYTAGNTKSSDFPTTSGTAQPNYAGNNDMFVVSFCAIAPNNTIANSGEDTIFVCPGTPLPFLDGSVPFGGSGQYTFQYQSAVPGGNFTNIPGATSEDYQVVNISSTTIFRRVVYDGDCESISPEVTIFFTQQPVADFTTDAACDAFGDSVQFTNLSQANGGIITSYKYYFGDGDSSNIPNPAHLYDSAGAYTAMLIILTNQGCIDTAIQVVDVSYTPVADFSTINPCANQPMYFNNLTTIIAGAVNYFWSFGDDSTSTDVNPIHYYADTGSYVVQLIATSGSCADTVEKTVNILQSPIADFSFDITCPDTAVEFTNLSSIAFGSIVSYEWNFGDNTSSTQANPTKIFPRNGPFTVELVATANTGCTDTVSKEVNPDSVITADFSYINNCLDLPTQFNSLSTSTNGTIVSYEWDFDDGFQSTIKNPSHTYTSTGTYDVLLVVTSDIGCVDSIVKTVVINPPPVANFTVLDECPGTSINITNLSISSASNVEYIWDFGDGTGSSDFEPVKSYDTSGTFTINLTVINDFGCVHDTSIDVNIYPEPVTDFDFGPVSCLDSVIDFTNNSSITSGSIVQYVWTFGDGGSSVLTNPSHTYTDAGTYNVSLIAISNNGCSDTNIQIININPEPVARLAFDDACSGVDILFSNLSISTISSPTYLWEFGDGTSSTNFEPVKSYATEGTYTVTLTINENGCTDDTSHIINILPDPVADFNYSSLNCLNAPVSFTNASSISSGSIDSYFWNFGDGTTSTDENPTHSYSASGTFTVSLIVSSNSACMDTISKNLVLTVAPIANFTTNSTCVGQDVKFRDSTITEDSIKSYHYDFGDGNTSSQKDPINVYQNMGNYTVTLTVNTLSGCTHTISKSVYISPAPFVDAGADRTFISGNAAGIQLNATGSGSGSYRWTPIEGLNTNNNPNPLANPDTTTTYTVTFTDELGCIAKDNITISVLSKFKIPTAFSPNNDGYNDFFEISKIECFPDHQIRIYDQWGGLLYSNKGSYHNNPWDGTHDGEPMPFASYFYILELNTDNFNGTCNDITDPPTQKTYKGTVTILR